MRGRGLTGRIVPAAILVVAAGAGVGTGSLTGYVTEPSDATTTRSEASVNLLYYADGVIHDGELRRDSHSGRRMTDLTRTADGWALEQRRPGNAARLLMLRSNGQAVARQRIGTASFDVSPDGRRVAYPMGDEVHVVAATSGQLVDTVDAGLADVETVFYSDNDLVIGGTTTGGISRVVLWDASRSRIVDLPYQNVTLADASESGGFAVLEDEGIDPPCPRVVQIKPLDMMSVWQPACGPGENRYEYVLSPDGRYLLTYIGGSASVSPSTLEVTDMQQPDTTVTIGDADVVDAGWQGDDSLLIATRIDGRPESYRMLLCTVDGDCEESGDTRGAVVIGRVN